MWFDNQSRMFELLLETAEGENLKYFPSDLFSRYMSELNSVFDGSNTDWEAEKAKVYVEEEIDAEKCGDWARVLTSVTAAVATISGNEPENKDQIMHGFEQSVVALYSSDSPPAQVRLYQLINGMFCPENKDLRNDLGGLINGIENDKIKRYLELYISGLDENPDLPTSEEQIKDPHLAYLSARLESASLRQQVASVAPQKSVSFWYKFATWFGGRTILTMAWLALLFASLVAFVFWVGSPTTYYDAFKENYVERLKNINEDNLIVPIASENAAKEAGN